MMTSIIQLKETIMEKIQIYYKNFIQKKNEFVLEIMTIFSVFPGWIIIGVMLLLFPLNDLITISISGSIIYLTIVIKQYVKHRIEKELLESIDIDRFGSNGDKKKSVLDIIDEYIENCFDRDVIFFNIINKDDYIDKETERRLLNELLDSALYNMSEEIRKKLSLYVTNDGLTRIIGRRCMMVVTIFVANHNKNIYQRSNDKKIEL